MYLYNAYIYTYILFDVYLQFRLTIFDQHILTFHKFVEFLHLRRVSKSSLYCLIASNYANESDVRSLYTI